MSEPTTTILIADDEPLFREITAEVMRDAGFRVIEACDGEQAIAELQRSRLDLVLLDVNMPRVSGWGVLEHVYRMPIRPRVVLMTGLHEVVHPGHLAPHIHGRLTKPFTAPLLLQMLATVLARLAVEPASQCAFGA